ncbi:MAG: hypothetical protein AB7J30_01935 [Hyphomicrobium sp.]|uniref:hypothetical protein n=1 Tax=Hyphomicrobium sp. TaxID=82 RepID=UPI003D150FFB
MNWPPKHGWTREPSINDTKGEAPPASETETPPVPENTEPAETKFDFDDETAAALLIPILRAWMDDNMKEAFIKALRAEAGIS